MTENPLPFPPIGFIGAGRLATTLAMAWSSAGIPLIGAASRRLASAKALAERCPSSNLRAFDEIQALVDHCDLLFITVPDDEIGKLVSGLRWRQGQSVVHCSGATPVSVLASAAQTGAAIGGFHPLQIFSNPDVAVHLLAGSRVAIEASGNLDAWLNRLAQVSGMHPLRLPPGGRVAYHVAGNMAASCLLAVLKAAEDIWAHSGLPREEALAALMPLSMGTLASARDAGLAQALSGPVSRGDSNVIRAHLDTVRTREGNIHLYAELLAELLELASKAGRIDHGKIPEISDLIDSHRQ